MHRAPLVSPSRVWKLAVAATALGFAPAITIAAPQPLELVKAARSQIGVTLTYDAGYAVIAYPGGDVPKERGVCTDVVVRAFRQEGVDLQKEMHEDMKREFSAYPKRWGLKKPDPNIDHRRVPNLMTYFRRQGWSMSITKKPEDYAPGDIVSWDLAGDTLPHIGIVSDRKTDAGIPLVLHNIGRGAQEEDILFGYTITGHYRVKAK